MAERERTIVTRVLYRLNDLVFVAALSPRDRSSISQLVVHFCGDQETEIAPKRKRRGLVITIIGLGLINVSLSCTKYLRYSYNYNYHSNCYSTIT